MSFYLPPELWIHIISHLSFHEGIHLTYVSKKWRQWFWCTREHIHFFPEKQEDLLMIARNCPQLKSVSIVRQKKTRKGALSILICWYKIYKRIFLNYDI